MSDLLNKIMKIEASKPYIDYNNYHRGNIFGITKSSRWELVHSNFVAWALNPSSSHGLRFYPLYQLVKTLMLIQSNNDNVQARKFSKELEYKFYGDSFIVDAVVKREEANVDIVVEIVTKEKILPIIIENKVNSDENGKNKNQTQVYFDWAEKTYEDKNIYFAPIYVFLYPEYNATKQSSSEYIRMTYQNMVDYILEPSMEKCGDIVSINNYKTYLQCLSYQTDNDKGEDTMAISKEERKILNDFVEKNRDLLCAVINELPDIDPTAITAVTNGIKNSKLYEFNGKTYGVGRLVLAVVTQYVNDNPNVDFPTLQTAFPASLRGGSGVVQLKTSVPDAEQGIGGIRRYFVNTNEIIVLSNNDEVLVSDQWTKERMPEFIKNANGLGYTITPV